jgi:hypothetical protein
MTLNTLCGVLNIEYSNTFQMNSMCNVHMNCSKGMYKCVSWVFMVLNVHSLDSYTGCIKQVFGTQCTSVSVTVLCVHRLGSFTGSITQAFGTQCSRVYDSTQDNYYLKIFSKVAMTVDDRCSLRLLCY